MASTATDAQQTNATDYATWTPEQLVNRIQILERQLAVRRVPRASPSTTASTHSPTTSKTSPQKHTKKPGKHNARPFDPSKYTTRFIALKIAYLGQKYNGYEHHTGNTTPLPTVEEMLWRALVRTKLLFKDEALGVDWRDVEYSKAGRTDLGVSAFGNVIGIRVRSARPPERDSTATAAEEDGTDGESERKDAPKREWDHIADELPYIRLLNRVLPHDIRVLAWCPSPPPDFSARFSCRLRKYRYFFTQPAYCPAPGARGVAATRVSAPEREGWLDIPAMQDAASRYEGAHDFRNFCKQDPARQISNFERRVDRAVVVPVERGELGLPFAADADVRPLNEKTTSEPQLFAFEVWGSAFLWHQVRHMVAMLFLVGQGLEAPDVVDRLLDVQQIREKPLYEMADDHPLVLWDCVFPDLEKGGMEESLEWILPDHPVGEAPWNGGGDGRYGMIGINDVLWAGWRKAKINEVLAAQLLDKVASQRIGPHATPLPENANQSPRGVSTRVYDGGETVKHKGQYVPVLEKQRQEAAEVLNARWLLRNNPDAAAVPDADAANE